MPVGVKYNIRQKSLQSWLKLEKQKYAFFSHVWILQYETEELQKFLNYLGIKYYIK